MQSWNHVEIKQHSDYLNHKFASKALFTSQFHLRLFLLSIARLKLTKKVKQSFQHFLIIGKWLLNKVAIFKHTNFTKLNISYVGLF